MKLRIWFKQPMEIDLEKCDDPVAAKEFVENATQEELELYIVANYDDLISPKVVISSVEVVE